MSSPLPLANEQRVRNSFALALLLTLGFAAVEAVAGWWSGSLALMADAGHMVTDAFGLALALLAASLSRRKAGAGFSYGYRRIEVLAALINTLIMLALVAWLVIEAGARLRNPQPVIGVAVMAVASAGLLLNVAVLMLLRRTGSGGLNVRGALLHVVGDLLGSVAALTAGLVIWMTGWTPIDPLLTLLIALLILISALRLLWQIALVLMEASPPGIKLDAVRDALLAEGGVDNVHDLHVWTLAGDRILLSAHLQLLEDCEWSALLPRLQQRLSRDFGIHHATLQAEPASYVRALRQGSSEQASDALDDHLH